jgi:hypothetical protein
MMVMVEGENEKVEERGDVHRLMSVDIVFYHQNVRCVSLHSFVA